MSDTFDAVCKWIDEIRPFHVTIQTILDLEPGEILRCLCFDRNFGDLFGDMNICETFIPDAEETFPDNYYLRFTKGPKKDSIEGDFFIACGIKEIDYPDNDPRHEWLHIEYYQNCWYPLQNGVFQVIDRQFNRRLVEGEDRHWRDYPLGTRLGWRGPMIPIEDINKIPIKINEV